MEEESEFTVHPRWTEADLEYLRKNYRDLTARVMAAHLNRSRSAVCGKLHRMGLSRPVTGFRMGHTGGRPRKEPRSKIKAFKPSFNEPRYTRPRPEPLQKISVKSMEPVAPKHIHLLELEAGECKWPFGQGPYTFCGHTTEHGDRYCPYHNWLSSRRS